MNQYHIYEAIGRGKHSVMVFFFLFLFVFCKFVNLNDWCFFFLQTVYKGRKKKTIEYFAVKSVDKSQKNKVLHEVRNHLIVILRLNSCGSYMAN